MRPLLALAACALLAACGTHPADAPPISSAPAPVIKTVVKQVCITPTPWSKADQTKLALALVSLSDSSIVWTLYHDWQRTRDEENACLAAQKQ